MKTGLETVERKAINKVLQPQGKSLCGCCNEVKDIETGFGAGKDGQVDTRTGLIKYYVRAYCIECDSVRSKGYALARKLKALYL